MTTADPFNVRLVIEKTVMIRKFDAELYKAVKAQAAADGMYLNRWIENALRRELARVGKKTEN